MNRSALAVALLLTLSLPVAARADEASHRAKAQEMIVLLHTDRMVKQVSANFMKQLSTAGEKLIGPNATDAKKTELAEFEKKFAAMIDAQVGWDILQPTLTDYYTKAFTEEELDVIVAFYKTPAGAALVERMPAVNTQATQLLQSKMAAVQPQMKQMYEDFQKSQTASAAPAAASTPAASASAPK
ncbi:MAG TPA: DUF2059 domain-containing protein [Acidobacteriaceae bacterium]|jgi:hypothetical protein